MYLYYPHMRGWSYGTRNSADSADVLPAHAGVIPLSTPISEVIGEYYPHMRGWSYKFHLIQVWPQVLPAHAGVILN